MSRSSMQPKWMDGKFEPRLMLPLSLSYDHRMIDGADAARFLRWIAEAFEQPFPLVGSGITYTYMTAKYKPQAGCCWRRSRRLRRRISGCGHGHAGHAHRSRTQSRWRLPVPRMHPLQGAASRRLCASRSQARRRFRHRVQRARHRSRPPPRLQRERCQEAYLRPGQLAKQRKVTYVRGMASFEIRRPYASRKKAARKSQMKFDRILIATGSRPAVVPTLKIDSLA